MFYFAKSVVLLFYFVLYIVRTGTNPQPIKREVESLHKGARDWKQYHSTTSKDNGNRILHWDSLRNLITSNTKRKYCGTDVSLKELTTGLATQVILTCNNPNCNTREKNKVKKTNYREHKFRVDSTESFAINCQFVLSLLQCGCGSSEAETFLTFQNLPNAPSFKIFFFKSRMQYERKLRKSQMIV